VTSAKRPQTRARRVAEAARRLARGLKLPTLPNPGKRRAGDRGGRGGARPA
jgi:hypothetical protein